MLDLLTYFAHEEAAVTAAPVAEATAHATESAGGLSALGLNWQSFLFQLITFVIVLLILRKFVFGKLVATLDSRQKAVEDSIKNAQETEEKLKNAETTIAGLIADARKEADDIIARSHKEATTMISEAEEKAKARAEQIIADARSQFENEVVKARQALKKDTIELVALATEKVVKEKLDARKDAELIKEALQEKA